MLARPGGQSGGAAGGRRDRAGPEGGAGSAGMEDGTVGGAKKDGSSRDDQCLPQTRSSRDGRRFLVVDDLLSKLGSPLSLSRGRSDEPPYWDALCAGVCGDTKVRTIKSQGGQRSEEWLVDPEGALMVSFLEQEAGRASAKQAKRMRKRIRIAFELGHVRSENLRKIAEDAGFVRKGHGSVQGEGEGRSSSSEMPCKKKGPSPNIAEQPDFFHRRKHDGRFYVQLAPLHHYVSKQDRKPGTRFFHFKRYPYLVKLQEHGTHMFKEAGWLVSPEFALLVVSEELKANRASKDRAERARGEILRKFDSMPELESLDLDDLASELGLKDGIVVKKTHFQQRSSSSALRSRTSSSSAVAGMRKGKKPRTSAVATGAFSVQAAANDTDFEEEEDDDDGDLDDKDWHEEAEYSHSAFGSKQKRAASSALHSVRGARSGGNIDDRKKSSGLPDEAARAFKSLKREDGQKQMEEFRSVDIEEKSGGDPAEDDICSEISKTAEIRPQIERERLLRESIEEEIASADEIGRLLQQCKLELLRKVYENLRCQSIESEQRLLQRRMIVDSQAVSGVSMSSLKGCSHRHRP